MIKAIFPGSFDPPTFGHLNVIERATKLFDEIHVVIAVNPRKKYLFSEQERVSMMRELTKKWDSVFVHTCNTIVVDYAKKIQAQVLLRGIRNITDFSYEFDLSILNKGLSPGIETIFIPTDPKYFVLKSSAIKELAAFGGDISRMVPKIVEGKMKEKFPQSSNHVKQE